MGLALPSELLPSSKDNHLCRSAQLQQLTVLYNVGSRLRITELQANPPQDLYPPPRSLVVYGLQSTGKLHTVCSVLTARKIAHAVVRSNECLSLRHLWYKIYTACITAVSRDEDDNAGAALESRTESVHALSVNLQRLLGGRDEKLVLVLEGIDNQRGLNSNTLPAVARLSDIVCAIA